MTDGIFQEEMVEDSFASLPEYCLGCPHPIYDNRHGKGRQWYCRLHSPTGIPCTNDAVLQNRCLRVRGYYRRGGAA